GFRRVAGALRGLRGGLLQLFAEEVGVELSETAADAIRRRLRDDEEREHEEQRRNDHPEPEDVARHERLARHPSDDTAASGERHGSIRRLRRAAEEMAQRAHADEEYDEAHAQPTVVVDRR